jgi:hypothetical protein
MNVIYTDPAIKTQLIISIASTFPSVLLMQKAYVVGVKPIGCICFVFIPSVISYIAINTRIITEAIISGSMKQSVFGIDHFTQSLILMPTF